MSAPFPVRLWQAVATAWRGDAKPVRAAARSFNGAQAGRLLGDWPGTAQSADKSTRYQAKALRFRARELRENSPIVAKYASLVRDNVVGPNGITLQAVVPSSRGINVAASTAIEAAWYEWGANCTPDGRTWNEVCALVAETCQVEGEALLELIPSSAAPMGLWVQPLDTDLLDDRKNVDRTPNGGRITQGVEYDAAGRIAAYHILTKHPSDGGESQYRVLPANRLLRLAHRPRPQQTRGVTKLAPVMVLIQHLDRLEEAIVVLNRVTAAKMGALIPGADAQPIDGLDGAPPMIEQAPAEWWTLPQGWDVKMLDPGQPTQEFDAFARHLKREIAAGLDVSYASLTGDLSDVNYSSMRAGLLVERDAWQSAQQAFIAAVVEPVFRLWLGTAQLSRAIQMPPGQTPDRIARASAWHPRRWPWVDPLKDAQGIELLLSMGLTTRTREANKQGLAFTDLVDERAAEERYLAQAGLSDMDTDSDAPSTASPTAPDDVEDDVDDDTPARQLKAV